MIAYILTIGDEILTGQTIDTNSAHIASQLNLIGIKIIESKTISDTENHINSSLDHALSVANLVIITGGLGPTNDDITKSVLTAYFNDHLEMNQEVLQDIEAYFGNAIRPILEVNRQQAMLPSKAKIIRNDLGTASGMWFSKENKNVISLPGVPYEMIGLMEKIIPLFQEKFHLANFYHRTILFQGIGESKLAEEIKEHENQCVKDNIGVAYLPSPGIVKIRFTGTEADKSKINSTINILKSKYPKWIFGEEEDKLEALIGQMLISENKTIGTVESCTGGGIAKKIASIPGSSQYFMGSIVSYDNRIKSDVVGVNSDLIINHGAVSKEVVESMAKNGRKNLGIDYCISSSGIAGPDGGSDEKPVGTVWLAIASAEKVYSKQFKFSHNRERNIELSIVFALNFLRRILLNLEEDS